MAIENRKWKIGGALLTGLLLVVPLHAEDIRIDLDKRDDPRVKSRIDAKGYSIHIDADGHLQKGEPTRIRIETQQKGHWDSPKLDAGRYLKAQFDTEKPDNIHMETTLKFDSGAGERRFSQERDAIQRELGKRTSGKDGAAAGKARVQLLIERIGLLREENIKAGADKRGKGNAHTPPLPRPALNFEKPDALERLLKEQCCWLGVAEVYKATGFPPPDEKEYPDFTASQMMAEEIRQAVAGNKFTPRHLSESQYKTLEQGSRYEFTARFVPEVAGAATDLLWKTAPAVRLADGLVKRAQIEGSLDRERALFVAWWRVECETPSRIQTDMPRGAGDCFWTWVETPNAHVRYLRLLLHSPGTRYKITLTLSGATKGDELTLYDGPINAPAKGPF